MTSWLIYQNRRLRDLGTHQVMLSAKPLIETPAETLREAQTKTHSHPLRDVKVEVISDTLVEEKASKVVDTWPDTVARVEIRKVHDTLGQLEGKALMRTRSHALA